MANLPVRSYTGMLDGAKPIAFLINAAGMLTI